MLSRSSSNAGSRLRRAKSTSSAQTAASGHQRHSTTLDPSTSRLNAEVAAVEAYERARQHDELSALTSRPKPNRRRSQISGKSEGSHFEEARRKSLSQTADTVRPKPSQSSLAHHRHTLPSQIRRDASGEERIITRRRSVIPPAGPPTTFLHSEHATSISTGRPGRKTQSEYTDGSPAPRYSQCLQDPQSTMQLGSLVNESTETDEEETTHATVTDILPRSRQRSPPRPSRPSVREKQTDEKMKPQATNQYLQGLEHQRLRERKSFIFSTFQKRRTGTPNHKFDNSLPPFNYAADGDAAPIPPNPATLAPGIVKEHKPRNFSSSLKGRLKNVFRKPSRAPPGLPAQHVEARDFHFTVKDYDLSEDADDQVDYADPFMTVAAEDPRATIIPPHVRPHSNNSHRNVDSTKSRVTSWANSTVGAMSSIRTNNGPFARSSPAPVLHRTGSQHTLRKRSSFLGGPIRNKLRRASKADLKGSDESVGLYTALQKRIRSSKSVEPIKPPVISAPLELGAFPTSNAIASLPSQRQYPSVSTASINGGRASTIRTITPDPTAYGVDIPSPVHEVASPTISNEDIDATVIHHAGCESTESSPQHGLRRRSAMKAAPPSQSALARRVERARNRWQSPLDEILPSAPWMATKRSDTNPYELPSLGQTTREVTPVSGAPHHTKVGSAHRDRATVISPSVYSRATDGATPRQMSPELEDGTIITITGHEVRRYSISPPKPIRESQHRGQGSGAWRKWLSDEMNSSLGNEEPRVVLPSGVFAPAQRHNSAVSALSRPPGHKRSVASITAELRPGSVSPLSENGTLASRPRSRASSKGSCMNGRYPMMSGSRNASRESLATMRKASPPPSVPENAEGRLLHSVAMAKKPSIDAALHSTTIARPRASSRGPVFGQMTTVPREQSALQNHAGTEPVKAQHQSIDLPLHTRHPIPTAVTVSPSPRTAKPFNRPKSAYELRVNYRNNASERSKPLEIRRKPIEHHHHDHNTTNTTTIIDDDSTILNIAAGPYASAPPVSQRPASANQENTRPIDSPLQSLSSSEWLATGSSKKRDAARRISAVNGQRTASPLAPQQGNGLKGERSPGQRLVTNWLDGRRSPREGLGGGGVVATATATTKEGTPAFV